MRLARALVLAGTLLAPIAPAAPPPAANVQAAVKQLQTAREKMEAAMKKVEGDAPTTADLDAAHETLNAVKDAIDSGAAQEPNDLDYAKAALAARKELREKRDFVDARRAKVHIFNLRRQIDEKLAVLKEKGKAVDAKDASTKEFDEARAAVKELRKVAGEGKQFTAQDAAFASYLSDVEALAAKVEKTADEKWALAEGDKHRARVEEARTAFTSAMAVLSPNATDEQFRTAESAGSVLTQRLDEGKVLEAKDKGYGAYATKTRGELAAAKKKADELWSQTGLARLKAEIEPTAKDLQNAAKIVRGKKPSADQLAEARTIAIVARKLIEKFQPEAKRSAAFGEYVEGVKGTLAEVEGNLQLRALDVAVRDFRQALAKLDRRAPTDDDFAVANSALLVLDKTLEPMNARDPALSAAVGDAKTWQREGKATITKRRLELDVAAQKVKVEQARDRVTKAVGVMERAESGEDSVKGVEDAIKDALAALEPGAELTKKDREYAAYDREVKKRLDEATRKIATKRLQLTVAGSRTELSESLAAAKAKIEAARAPSGTDADLEAAQKSVEATNTLLEGKAELETKSGGYAAIAERGRMDLMKRMEWLELARMERDVRKRTVDAFNPALQATETAANSKDLRVQKSNYEKALQLFKSCKDEGAKIIEQTPQYGRLAVLAGGLPSTVTQVVKECAGKAEEVAPLIKPLVGLIAFEDGPRKAYEAAVQLQSKGKKTEALAQFDECTATGVTLSVRNPELKERSFTVAGAPMTLTELTKQCSAKSKELRGK